MTEARDSVIDYVKRQIKFYQGRGKDYDLLVTELKQVLMVMEKETKW